MAEKIDFKKKLKTLYNPGKGSFHLVDVPAMKYLLVDGEGDPNVTPAYQRAVETLYSLSYGIKFAYKSQGLDHIVPPLEGLWWMEDMREFTVENKPRWKWTMMIMQPEWVTAEVVEKVKTQVIKKNKGDGLSPFRFDYFQEGLCVQILYTGAYVNEGPTIAEMHSYLHSNGFMESGKHHEIYLGDPRKTSPERLQTILRQPIRKI